MKKRRTKYILIVASVLVVLTLSMLILKNTILKDNTTPTEKEVVEEPKAAPGDIVTIHLVQPDATAQGQPSIEAEVGAYPPSITALPRQYYYVRFVLSGNNVVYNTATVQYIFNGYFSQPNCSGSRYFDGDGNPIRIYDGMTNTLYACWSENSVTLPSTSYNGHQVGAWFDGGEEGSNTNLIGYSGEQFVPITNTTLFAHYYYRVTLYSDSSTSVGTPYVQAINGAPMPNITPPQKRFNITLNYNGSGQSNTNTQFIYAFNGYFDAQTGGTRYYNTGGTSSHIWDKMSDTTLYAQWSRQSFSLPTPTRDGYTFTGWYTTSTGGSQINAGSFNPSGNMTIYAHWTPKQYAVTLDGNGATTNGTTNIQATYGSAMPYISLPQKRYTISFNPNGGSGSTIQTTYQYVFDGYYTSNNGGGIKYYTSSGSSARVWDRTSSTTLIANWTKPNFTFPTNLTRNGYTFAGWYTTATGGSLVQQATFAPTANTALYAQWTPNTYSVKFDANGGTGTMSNQTMTYDVLANLSTNSFTKEAYVFKGWNTKADGTGTNYTNGESVKNLTTTNGGTITLYAQWNAGTYTITYELDGGGTSELNPTTYNIETPTFTLHNPTKEGYTFTGWTGSNGDTPQTTVTINTGSTGNKTFTAHYSINTYTITFVTDDGEVTKEGEYNSVITDMPTVTKTGYTFVGWFNEDNEVLGDRITSNETVHPVFRPNKYRIVFNSNNGKGTMANQEMTYDESYNLTKNTFTRDKYIFKEWNTKEDGTGTAYKDQATIKNLTAEDDKGIVLYAIWTANTVDEKTEEKESSKEKNPHTGYSVSALIIIVLIAFAAVMYTTSNKKASIKKL